jgi:FkbM family methyltransferase
VNPLLKHHAKKIASGLGVNLRQTRPRRSSLDAFCRHLKSLGYAPRTVIDVGVADGTIELHTNFPTAEFLLVEPLEEFWPAMSWLSEHYRCQIALAAAGAEDGTAIIHHGKTVGDMHGATLADMEDPAELAANEAREIPVRRVDTLVREFRLNGPFLLKIDAQGYELDVVTGAEGILPAVDVLIMEVTFFNFNRRQPLVDEVLKFMLARGYFPYDLFGGYNRPLDGALAQVDVAFVKRDGLFRRDHRHEDPNIEPSWSTKAGWMARRMLKV